MKIQRIYNDGSLGIKKNIDTSQVIFLQEGDKVPGDFVEFKLLPSETSLNLFALNLFEIGCSSNEPGFTYKVVSIPYGTYINKEEMVVERY